jgi:hypothetical protein
MTQEEEQQNKIVEDYFKQMNIVIKSRMLNVDKLSNDLQYKMEITVNAMVEQLIKYHDDCDDDDEEVSIIDYKNDSLFLEQFKNMYDDNSDIIGHYIETVFNPVVDQVELVKYAKSYMIEVVGMSLECYNGMCNIDFYKNEEERVYYRVLAGIETFIKMNEQFILDSFHTIGNNVILK